MSNWTLEPYDEDADEAPEQDCGQADEPPEQDGESDGS